MSMTEIIMECDALKQQLVDYVTKHEVACSTINILQEKCDVRGKALAEQCKETRKLHEQLATKDAEIERLLCKILSDYDGIHRLDLWDKDAMPSREWNIKRREALAATADLDGLVLCDAEPVLLFRRKGVSNDFCTCDASRFNEVSKMPHLFEVKKLYKAKEQP